MTRVIGRPGRRHATIAKVVLLVAVSASLVPAQGAAAKADRPGLMVAFDRDTGRELWRVKTLPYFALADVSSRTVVGRGSNCGGSGFENVAFAARDGQVRWRSPAGEDVGVRGGDLASSGSEQSGVVVVVRSGTDTAVIEGRDARSGAIRWRVPTVPYAFVHVNADSVAVTAEGITVVERRTGAERWSRSYPLDHEIQVMLGERALAITETEGNGQENLGTEMLDASDGRHLWTAELAPAAIGRAATALAVSSTPSAKAPPAIEIRSTTTGALQWTGDRLSSLVSVAGGRVLTFSSWEPGSAGRRLNSFDVSTARNGEELWSTKTKSMPVLDRDTVVYLDKGGALVAADASDGSTRWRASLPQTAEIAEVTVGRDAVYVTMGCFPLD